MHCSKMRKEFRLNMRPKTARNNLRVFLASHIPQVATIEYLGYFAETYGKNLALEHTLHGLSVHDECHANANAIYYDAFVLDMLTRSVIKRHKELLFAQLETLKFALRCLKWEISYTAEISLQGSCRSQIPAVVTARRQCRLLEEEVCSKSPLDLTHYSFKFDSGSCSSSQCSDDVFDPMDDGDDSEDDYFECDCATLENVGHPHVEDSGHWIDKTRTLVTDGKRIRLFDAQGSNDLGCLRPRRDNVTLLTDVVFQQNVTFDQRKKLPDVGVRYAVFKDAFEQSENESRCACCHIRQADSGPTVIPAEDGAMSAYLEFCNLFSCCSMACVFLLANGERGTGDANRSNDAASSQHMLGLTALSYTNVDFLCQCRLGNQAALVLQYIREITNTVDTLSKNGVQFHREITEHLIPLLNCTGTLTNSHLRAAKFKLQSSNYTISTHRKTRCIADNLHAHTLLDKSQIRKIPFSLQKHYRGIGLRRVPSFTRCANHTCTVHICTSELHVLPTAFKMISPHAPGGVAYLCSKQCCMSYVKVHSKYASTASSVDGK